MKGFYERILLLFLHCLMKDVLKFETKPLFKRPHMLNLDPCMAVGLTDTLFWPMQNSEAVAVQQAAAAESSNAQLTLLAQDHQRNVQELSDSRDAAAVLHQQALQTLREAKDLAEVRLSTSYLWCSMWCILLPSYIACGLPLLHLFTGLNSPSS